jgi:hypothetical protein
MLFDLPHRAQRNATRPGLPPIGKIVATCSICRWHRLQLDCSADFIAAPYHTYEYTDVPLQGRQDHQTDCAIRGWFTLDNPRAYQHGLYP